MNVAVPSSFRRPYWLGGRHLETVAAAFSRAPAVAFRRCIAQTFDDDEIAVDYALGARRQPACVLFHGLEGCSQSHTIRLIADRLIAAGWTVVVPHFRSCGGYMNKYARAYHGGDTDDIGWMLTYCADRFPASRLFALGVSLGGGALINWLSLNLQKPFLSAAATVCTPFDLAAAVHAIDHGVNRFLYARHFLNSLRAKVEYKSRLFPGLCDMKRLRAARTLGEFDDIYTAPAHGFVDARDYWNRASAKNSVAKIKLPLLCINSDNDPLAPKKSLPPDDGKIGDKVVFYRPQHGGHGGFIGSPKNWLGDSVLQFFCRYMNAR